VLLRLLPYTARWRLYGGVRVRPASSGAVPARVARAACAHVGRATSAACLSSVTAAQWCPACVPSRISPRVVQQVLPPTHARAGGRSHKHLSAGVAPACQYAAELACSQTRMAFALLCAGARCHVDNPGARGSGRARRRPRRARRCWPARPRWRRASAARCCGACASSPTSARSGARGCHSRACSPRSRTPMRSRCSTPSSAWRAPAQYLFFFFPFAGEKQVLSCQRLEGRWRRGVRLHAGERAPPNLSGVLADARAGDDGVDVHQPLRWWIGGCQPAGRSGARRMSDLRGPNCVWIDVQWSCRRGVALQRSMQGLRPLGCSEAAQKAMTPLPGQTRP